MIFQHVYVDHLICHSPSMSGLCIGLVHANSTSCCLHQILRRILQVRGLRHHRIDRCSLLCMLTLAEPIGSDSTRRYVILRQQLARPAFRDFSFCASMLVSRYSTSSSASRACGLQHKPVERPRSAICDWARHHGIVWVGHLQSSRLMTME